MRASIAFSALVLGVASVSQLASAATFTGTLTQALAKLSVAAEVRTGYDRDLFPLWIDEDGDGCNTREEVLIDEAVTAPTVGSSCAITGGKWFSYYDAKYFTDKADLDIDHLVPLAEAWDSGARSWTTAKRQKYANDLGDYRALVAVSASTNRSKGDKDPAEWVPDNGLCRYIAEWLAVKIRWSLTIDSAEKSALSSYISGCPATTITVATA
ncbi:putative S-layer domain protein [Cladochytrium replicatum]|nr:putative S-layer domain protein [Cladochytrium replicatum]